MRKLLALVLVALLLLPSTCQAQHPDVEKIKSDLIAWAQIIITIIAVVLIVIAVAKVGYGAIHMTMGVGPYASARGWGEIFEGVKGILVFAIALLLLIWIPSLLFGWGIVNQPLYNVLSDAISRIFGGLKP